MAFKMLDRVRRQASAGIQRPDQPPVSDVTPTFRQPRGPLMPRTDPPVPNSSPDFTTPTPGYAPANNGGVAGGRPPQMPQFGGNRYDQGYMQAQLQQFAQLPGVDPTVTSDPAYWLRRMSETGGLGPDNVAYWQDKALNEYKKPMPGSQGQGGNPMGLILQMMASRMQNPQAAQIPQMAQAAPQQAQQTQQDQTQGVNLEQLIQQIMSRTF